MFFIVFFSDFKHSSMMFDVLLHRPWSTTAKFNIQTAGPRSSPGGGPGCLGWEIHVQKVTTQKIKLITPKEPTNR